MGNIRRIAHVVLNQGNNVAHHAETIELAEGVLRMLSEIATLKKKADRGCHSGCMDHPGGVLPTSHYPGCMKAKCSELNYQIYKLKEKCDGLERRIDATHACPSCPERIDNPILKAKLEKMRAWVTPVLGPLGPNDNPGRACAQSEVRAILNRKGGGADGQHK